MGKKLIKYTELELSQIMIFNKKVYLKCYSSLNFQYVDPKISEQVLKSISLLSILQFF